MQLGTIKKDWQTLGLSFPKSFMWNLIEFNLHYLHCAPPRRPPAVCTVFIIHETQTVPNSSTLVGSSCSSSPDRRHHERDRPPAGRPVRQPDRVQGDISKYICSHCHGSCMYQARTMANAMASAQYDELGCTEKFIISVKDQF